MKLNKLIGILLFLVMSVFLNAANYIQSDPLSRSDAIVMIDSMRISVKTGADKNMDAYYNPFADVPDSAEYLPSLMRLAYYHSTSFDGNPINKYNDLFNPMRHMSREEFVAVAMTSFDIPKQSYNLSQFTDIANMSAWAVKYFETAVSYGIVSGNNGKLLARDKISVQEAFSILNGIKSKFANNYPFNVNSYDTPESLDLSQIYKKTVGSNYEPSNYKPEATPIKISGISTTKSGNYYLLTVNSTIDTANGASDYYWWSTDKGYFQEVSSSANCKTVKFYPLSTMPLSDYYITVNGGDNLGFADSTTMSIPKSEFTYPEDSIAVSSQYIISNLDSLTIPNKLTANSLFSIDLTNISVKKSNIELGVDQVDVKMTYNGQTYSLFHGTPQDKKVNLLVDDYYELYGQTVTISVELYSQTQKLSSPKIYRIKYLPQFKIDGKVYNTENQHISSIVINGNIRVPLDTNNAFSYTFDSENEIFNIKINAEQNIISNYFSEAHIDLTYASPQKIIVLAGSDLSEDDSNSVLDNNLDPTQPSTILSSQYINTANTFTVNWKSNNTQTLEILYSYDQLTWSRLVLKDLGTAQIGTLTESIPSLLQHDTIYFKTISTGSNGTQIVSNIKTLSYKTPVTSYIDKQTEPPATPSLYSVGTVVVSNSITLNWGRVNDSQKHDNVMYYEVMYATNSNFENATIVNVGNTATGSNINEFISYIVNDLKDNTRYYFKVRAHNNYNGGTDSSWSPLQSIYVDFQNLPQFDTTEQFPANGAVGISKTPIFRWSASDADGDVLKYNVTIGESLDALNYNSGWIEASTFFDFSNKFGESLKPNTTYYWQVTMREDGRDKAYYGGEYPKTPIWSFKTVAIGQDLAITNAKLIGELKPANPAVFELTIVNNGSETAKAEWIYAYYQKGNKTTQFNRGSVRMKKDLASGESEDVNITVEFEYDVSPPNSYNGYEERDNVLIIGDSKVIFDMPYISPADMDLANNRFEKTITYVDKGSPVFNRFDLRASRYMYGDSVGSSIPNFYAKTGGEPLHIHLGVVDDFKCDRAYIEYRLKESDEWTLIRSFLNNQQNYMDFRWVDINGTLQGQIPQYDWVIPDGFLTNSAQIRVRVYDDQNNETIKISEPFTIYSLMLRQNKKMLKY